MLLAISCSPSYWLSIIPYSLITQLQFFMLNFYLNRTGLGPSTDSNFGNRRRKKACWGLSSIPCEKVLVANMSFKHLMPLVLIFSFSYYSSFATNTQNRTAFYIPYTDKMFVISIIEYGLK